MKRGDTEATECCKARIYLSRADGVNVGSCAKCGNTVCRINPRTGHAEWLDGDSPWTERDDLRRMFDEEQTS